MKTIVNFSKYLSNNYFRYVQLIFLLLLTILLSDILMEIFQNTDQTELYIFALSFGKIGAALAFFSVLFYPLRKLYLYEKKRGKFPGNKVIPKIMILLSNLHPVVAVLALFFLFLHGYLFFKILLQFDLNIVSVSGLFALLMIFILFIIGSFLKVDMKNKKKRLLHAFMAIAFICLFILHKVVM